MQFSGNAGGLRKIAATVAAAMVIACGVQAGEGHDHGPATIHDGAGAIGLNNLPESALRDQIEKLPPQASQKALDTLSHMVLNDEDIAAIGVDNGGGVYYTCNFKAPAGDADEAAGVDGNDDPPVLSGPVPISQQPIYHSKPGAANVLYLDFNGHLVPSTTSWTSIDLQARPFSRDTDETTFSEDEQLQIYYTWLRVAEDFAAFDIDVTTEDPGAMGPNTGRLLFCPDTDANGNPMPSQGAGGVAYVNVWGSSYFASRYSPAFVYTDNLQNRNDYMAEAASHEAGHNLGLSHDGSNTTGYYSGHGSGETSWGPIMGTGYNDNVSQWSKGEYANANNTQDDLAIMNGKLGLRSDDHGDTLAGATVVAIDGSGALQSIGLIGLNGGLAKDYDVFAIDAGAGDLTVTVSPFRHPVNYRGCNLDVTLELLDGSGAVITTAAPADDVDASLTIGLTPGRYYLRVSGDGDGDPLTNGYSDYASQGEYRISGTVVPGVPTVVAPTISPNGGDFWPSVEVSISTITPDATITYTTDGSDPTTSGTASVYAGPFTLTQSATVRAVGSKADHNDSFVTSATFAAVQPQTATPVISPSGGAFYPDVTVSISSATSGADIYYTLDGSTPTSSSTPYAGSFLLTDTATVRAIATYPDYLDSAIASQTYTYVVPQYTISGEITGVEQAVTISAGGQSTSSYQSGKGKNKQWVYSLTLDAGSYDVSASLSGYTFSPDPAAVDLTTGNASNVNFAGIVDNGGGGDGYSISGEITGVNEPVTVSAGGASTQSYEQGKGKGKKWVYTIPDLPNGDYDVTASLAGYTFSPDPSSVTIAGASISGVNFTGTSDGGGSAGPWSISGEITGVEQAVTVSFGSYSAQSSLQGRGKNARWTYTISNIPDGTTADLTASLSGYSFSPSGINLTLVGDLANQDFSGTANVTSGTAPIIDSAWYSVATGGVVSLEVVASGADSIQWYVDGDAVDSTVTLASGTYTATVVASSGDAETDATIELVVP